MIAVSCSIQSSGSFILIARLPDESVGAVNSQLVCCLANSQSVNCHVLPEESGGAVHSLVSSVGSVAFSDCILFSAFSIDESPGKSDRLQQTCLLSSQKNQLVQLILSRFVVSC